MDGFPLDAGDPKLRRGLSSEDHTVVTPTSHKELSAIPLILQAGSHPQGFAQDILFALMPLSTKEVSRWSLVGLPSQAACSLRAGPLSARRWS